MSGLLLDEIRKHIVEAIRLQIQRMNVPLVSKEQANKAIERSKTYAKLCKIYKIPLETLYK